MKEIIKCALVNGNKKGCKLKANINFKINKM